MRISSLMKTILALSILLVSLPLTSAYLTDAQGTACPNAPQPRLIVGRQAHVTPGAANNLRAQPSRSAPILTQVQGGEYVDVIGGPTCAENMAWWQIQYGSLTGWMAEGSGNTYYVEPTTSPISPFGLIGTNQTVAVKFGGVSLTYNGAFGKTAEAATVYPVQANPNNPFQQPTPAYVEVRFPEAAQNPFRQPRLSVYPIADYQQANEQARQQIPALSTLLRAKPADPTGTIPSLPPVNAAQVFHSNVRYVTFGSGTGIRFLTMFAQGIGPVTNDQLWYLFQGVTNDGKYLVTAWFPISSSFLGATYDDAKDFPDLNSPQAADLFNAYVQKTTQKLNSAAPGTFTPNLDAVDMLLQSLIIQ